MLLRSDKYYAVKTSKKGIKAHSMINWCINKNHLIETKLSNKSIKLSNNLISWLDNHNDVERKHIIDEIFKIFEDNNIEDLNEDINIRKIIKIIKEIKNIDKETKTLLKDLFLSIINEKGEDYEKNN